MENRDKVRERVSEAYARAVTEPSDSCCCGSGSAQAVTEKMAMEITGKIWSARVYARKPE
ncbi:hypothetical protein HQ587_03940 [bacterium]|nr:hypothetical protein [bacterium]